VGIMEWITKVLEANPLSVALLVCVILALIAYRLIASKKANGDKGPSLWRVEELEREVRELTTKIGDVLPRLSGAEAEIKGLGRILELLHEGQQAINDKVDRVLDSLSK